MIACHVVHVAPTAQVTGPAPGYLSLTHLSEADSTRLMHLWSVPRVAL